MAEPTPAAPPEVVLGRQPDLPQGQWVEIAAFLFELLDQVDTASDIARQDLDGYRAMVQRIQALRFKVAATDGQRVVFFPPQQR